MSARPTLPSSIRLLVGWPRNAIGTSDHKIIGAQTQLARADWLTAFPQPDSFGKLLGFKRAPMQSASRNHNKAHCGSVLQESCDAHTSRFTC